MLRQKAVAINNAHNPDKSIPYYKSFLWAAGFTFSDASVLLKVPYSPRLPYLFFGEESLMALR
jgi:hypothetical protein